ncbi:Hypothetical_protein [Hexamita inflata]|uniref:Hypothetical_protein n=1 Tax=Hexamita inflata TaxID=28002 RepID=A0AA86PFV6_9EUKA|nr:Hypothetical protein HINF_LOCUS22885 [Hexamita inflata]
MLIRGLILDYIRKRFRVMYILSVGYSIQQLKLTLIVGLNSESPTLFNQYIISQNFLNVKEIIINSKSLHQIVPLFSHGVNVASTLFLNQVQLYHGCHSYKLHVQPLVSELTPFSENASEQSIQSMQSIYHQ